MTKFAGVLGFASSVEVYPGVWEDDVVERNYYGDILQQTRRWGDPSDVNPDLTFTNIFSIVADDDYLLTNFPNMRYIKWLGKAWSVSSVEIKPPRLLVRLGGMYNGTTL